MASEEHRLKMEAKRKRRASIYEREKHDDYVPANLGVNHPDYGMSMKDHEAEKVARNTQKSS